MPRIADHFSPINAVPALMPNLALAEEEEPDYLVFDLGLFIE